MIEAIGSTLSTAPLVQKSSSRLSSADSFAANPSRVQEAAPERVEIPFVSPSIRVDNEAKIAILEFRDSLSGDVLVQIPSEAQLEAYQRREAKDAIAQESELNGTNERIQRAEDSGDVAEAAVVRAEASVSEADIAAEISIST